MNSERHAWRWSGTGQRLALLAAWAEKVIPPLAVTAISVAGLLASVMQPRSQAPPALPTVPRAVAVAGAVPSPPLVARERVSAPGSQRTLAHRNSDV